MKLKIYLEIRMFHRNFLILSVPVFGLWYEAILAKLITMAYQTKLFSTKFEIGEHVAMWTRNPKKMLVLESLDGLELLIFAGFMEWHYIFSVIFGGLSVCMERVIASFLIRNYERNTQLYIPIFLTLFHQLITFTATYFIFFDKVNIIAANLIWIVSCVMASVMHFMIKKINKDWQKRMRNPKLRRQNIFTISQQFQVKENLRAVALAQKLLYSLFGVIAIGGIGIVVLILELVSPFFCHFLENIVFLNPYLICFVIMHSHPSWKEEFQKSLPSFKLSRRSTKIGGVVSVEPFDDLKKRSVIETDMYFKQLNDSWI